MTAETEFRRFKVLGYFSWAERPTAANHPGRVAVITDLGVGPAEFFSDGVNWVPCHPVVLKRQNAAVSGTAVTTLETLFTYTMPAGLMGLNGSIDFQFQGLVGDTADDKTFTATFGATTIYSANATTSGDLRVANSVSVHNRNAANAQIVFSGASSGILASAATTAAVDTTAAVIVALKTQKATAGDTITISHARLTLNG